jgi:DeoR/GlpR family transcriptional regulator of sugar metabolism
MFKSPQIALRRRDFGPAPVSKSLIPAQRRKQIQVFLEVNQVARSATLSEQLGVSEATIRRDLEWLEREGKLERTHGGAILTQRMPVEPEYARSAEAYPEEKRWIGRVAAALVEDGDTIFLNSGTTIAQVASHLRLRTDLTNTTVITNSLTATLEMAGAGFEVILLGGQFRTRAHSTFGHFATGMLRHVTADKAFIGVDGLTLRYGCTTPASAEAEVAQVMIERTHGPVIIVADHSKWGVVSNFEIASLGQIHGWICDERLGLEAREDLEARSLRIWLAGPETAASAWGGEALTGKSGHAAR